MRKSLITVICLLLALQRGQSQNLAAGITPAQALGTADSLYYLHEWSAAKNYYKQYLKDSSQNSLAWNRLGFCNQNLALNDEALRSYELSMANKPSPSLQAVVSFRVARIYASQDKKTEALDWLDKSIQGGFMNVQDMDTSRDFQSIRNDEKFQALYRKVVAAAFPCTANPKTKEFDFWIGEWEVYQTGSPLKVGHSLVQGISGGCAILENWTSMSGQSGKSINYFNPVSGKWEQDWMGSDGIAQRFLEGEYRDTALRFTYETVQNGQKAMGHFIFYNLGKDKVRQFQDISTDGGKTFSVSYDFTYIRKQP